MLITENSILGDVIDFDPDCTAIFASYGMHCAGCPAARGESIAEACVVHGVNQAELLLRLNNCIQNK